MKSNLAMAYGIKKKMAKGGSVASEKLDPGHESKRNLMKSPSSVVAGIMAKNKMADGGLVESDDSLEDDFLTAKDDHSSDDIVEANQTYPDADLKETPDNPSQEEWENGDGKKNILRKIMMGISNKAYGK